jgi:hypothetical protein
VSQYQARQLSVYTSSSFKKLHQFRGRNELFLPYHNHNSEILSHDIFKKMLQCLEKASSNHEIDVLKGRSGKSLVIHKWS